MTLPAAATPPPRTWRDIPQDIAPSALSAEGRKRRGRRTARLIAWSALGLASLYGGYEVWTTLQENPTRLKAPVKATPVRAVSLRTDGVLDQAWVKQSLALPVGADLMELDLFALRQRLVSHPQVRDAVVTRRFPDTLAVVLQERSPVARIMVQFKDQKPAPFCVARDGVLFEGVNQRRDFLDTLPFLEGVKIRRQGRGLAPLEGMDTIADLLQAARTNAPFLYAKWRVINVAQLRTDGLVRVRTADIPEVIFGTRENFTRQLAFLDTVIDEVRARAIPAPLRSVNLAVGLSGNGIQVPVAFDEVPATEDLEPNPLPPSSQRPAPARSRDTVWQKPTRPAARRTTSL
ncbi:cell division protein FtsQ/DivIB [Nibricoccus sp. IMCC34717]|uniref:cell division protein FtsQ/DivIB n=1 Tax=Nibricoccus sp. IMCC34717 TaxID=3034021 RepID=UPI00384E689B